MQRHSPPCSKNHFRKTLAAGLVTTCQGVIARDQEINMRFSLLSDLARLERD